jgi:hypothetical protein
MATRRQKTKAAALKAQENEAVDALSRAKHPPLMLGSFEVPAFDGLSAAFGARLPQYPPEKSIPAEFSGFSGKYQNIVSSLFFNGGKLADHGVKLKDGIDRAAAMTAIRAWMCSFDPSHEHKTATVAWALSEWTEPA